MTDADAPDATLGVAQSPPNASDTAMTDLQEKVKALEAKVADDKTTMLRLLADMENLRTRTARQLDDTKKFAVQKLAKELLSVADDLNRALQHVPTEALESQGAKEDVDYYQQVNEIPTNEQHTSSPRSVSPAPFPSPLFIHFSFHFHAYDYFYHQPSSHDVFDRDVTTSPALTRTLP